MKWCNLSFLLPAKEEVAGRSPRGAVLVWFLPQWRGSYQWLKKSRVAVPVMPFFFRRAARLRHPMQACRPKGQQSQQVTQ
jgi:hypothetical protein